MPIIRRFCNYFLLIAALPTGEALCTPTEAVREAQHEGDQDEGLDEEQVSNRIRGVHP